MDPMKGSISFNLGEKNYEVSAGVGVDGAPTFIASGVEDLRKNPETRKALKSYNMFTGKSGGYTDQELEKIKEEKKNSQV